MFLMNDVFMVPDIGTIYHGILKYGKLSINKHINVFCHGNLINCKIKSIHRKTLNVDNLFPNESGSLTFYESDKLLDKTAVIIDDEWNNYIKTEAKIKSVFDSIELKIQQYVLFIGNNIVTVIISFTNEKGVYDMKCTSNNSFLTDSHIGILKDDKHNYFFINLI
jgi:hypothetical protein